jgi:hypothetical protein
VKLCLHYSCVFLVRCSVKYRPTLSFVSHYWFRVLSKYVIKRPIDFQYANSSRELEMKVRLISSGCNYMRLMNLDFRIHGISLSLSLPVAPTLEHRAFLKRLVSFQFLNPKTIGMTSWTGINPFECCYLLKHRINADKHPCLEWDLNARFQCSSDRRHFMP